MRIAIVTEYEELSPYLPDAVVLFMDYFLWNRKARYDYNPQLWNARHPSTSIESILTDYQKQRLRKQFSRSFQISLRDAFASGMWYALLLTADDTPVAMARLTRRSKHECELHSVFVDTTHRRQGYGSLLLDHLIDTARSEGFKHMYLATLPFMTAAIQLYKTKGFEQVRYIDFGTSKDMAQALGTIFMQLDLQ